MKKKIISAVLSAAMVAAMLVGCGSSTPAPEGGAEAPADATAAEGGDATATAMTVPAGSFFSRRSVCRYIIAATTSKPLRPKPPKVKDISIWNF